MQNYLIKNTGVVNEGTIQTADVFVKDGRIEKISPQINRSNAGTIEINGEGKLLLPGAIDDQVHFREPGLTHKASIYTESKAAVAGGVTSFMEMPNTVPPAFTQQLLEEKYSIAARESLANYSFYIGTSNDNAEEVLKTNKRKKDVCGIKIFMGSSTGNLLVDNPQTLDRLFSDSELLIATHCEDERIIRENFQKLNANGKELMPQDHPVIRNEEACYASSSYAVQIAKKYNTRLHILHISTEKELELFTNQIPLDQKRITAEVCVHHLHFTSEDYAQLGYQIKCNPAIKAPPHKAALWKALLDDRLDVIATDHAPHTMEEKAIFRNDDGILKPVKSNAGYEKSHAGLPLIQHPLLLMLHYHSEGRISLEKIVEKMSHAVARCFQVKDRGFIREGYHADLVIADLNKSTTVKRENILYKCRWSPLEGFRFPATITHTFVNGNLVFTNPAGLAAEGSWNPIWNESSKGDRLEFNR